MAKSKREDDGLTRAERSFAREMRRLREAQGWTQGELAERIQGHELPYVTQSTVSRIENLTRPVRMIEAQALSRIFGRTVAALLDPDSREAWLHSAENDLKRASRKFVATRDVLRELASEMSLLEADLDALRYDFGDLGEIGEESRQLYDHLLSNIEAFITRDLVATLIEDIENAKKAAGRQMSPTGLSHMIVSMHRRGGDDVEHKETP